MKITVIEALVLAVIVIFLTFGVYSVYSLSDTVTNHGLKSVLENVWYGAEGER